MTALIRRQRTTWYFASKGSHALQGVKFCSTIET